ncbi:hypothetical protein DP47_3647 [Burkholderia pseudomallei Pasteur 52237]|nr:hypothetical protein DP47_3647 [Burkholderia pseudomallei Pasteur 52237]
MREVVRIDEAPGRRMLVGRQRDARVADQIVGAVRRAVPLDVRRRRAERERVRHQRMADQRRVAVEAAARDEARVVAGFDHVERALGERQLHAHLRVLAPVAVDERGDPAGRQQPGHGHAQCADGLVHRPLDGRLELIELLEERPAAVEIADARFRQRQIACRTMDETRVQMCFEHRDRTRDERIRYAEFPRRPAEALQFGNTYEDTHGLDLVHSFRWPIK